MPPLNPDAYIPRANEPAMMNSDQRAAACLAYHKELAEAGEGRLITFADGSAWWVPNDLGEVGKDIALVLTGKSDGMAAFVIGEALRVIMGQVKTAESPKLFISNESGANLEIFDRGNGRFVIGGVTQTAPAAPYSDERSVGAALSSLQRAATEQSRIMAHLAERLDAQTVEKPAPSVPVQAVAEAICARLEDAGFLNIDHNKPGVSRGALAFVNLYNGAQVRDREPVIPLPTPQQAIEATMEGVQRYAETAGSKRLVWRLYPALAAQDGGYVIRCRLLAMEAA